VSPLLETSSPPTLHPGDFVDAWNLDLTSPIILVVVVGGGLAFCAWLWWQLRGSTGTANAAGLNYVVGPMGAGKSMFGVRLIVDTIAAGRYCVTNVRLFAPAESEQCPEGAFVAIARKLFPRDARNPARLERRARWLEGHYIFERSLEQAMRYRIPCAKCGGDTRECGHSGPFQEGRAVFVWDETHNDLNNRDYQGHGSNREDRELEKERRRLILRWATQLRKLGFAGFLLSQHHENTDAQLRRVCNHLVRLQNQRSAGVGRLLPKRLTMFLVYWYPAHLADGTRLVKPVHFERYVLPWQRILYDSWETFHGLDDELEAARAPILLPSGGRYSKPRGVGDEAPPLGGVSPPAASVPVFSAQPSDASPPAVGREADRDAATRTPGLELA
jgi:hypothetical protein